MSTPREKLQDKLVLDGRRSLTLKRDETTRCRSASLRLWYLAQDRLDLAETAKHLAQRMSVNSTLSRWNVQLGIWWESPKQLWDFEDRNMLTTSQSSCTTTLLVTQSRGTARRDWWLRSVTTLWNLDRRFGAWQHWAFWEAEFYAVVERRSSWTILEICIPGSGIANEDWNTQWQFDGEFIDGSIGNRESNEAHRHAVRLGTRTSPRRRPQYQEGANSKERRRCWKEARLCFSTATILQVCRIGNLLTKDLTLYYKMKADEANDASGGRCCWPDMNTENRYRQRPDSITRKHKSTDTIICQRWLWTSRRNRWLWTSRRNQWTVDENGLVSRSTDHDSSYKKQTKGKVQSNGKMQREKLWTLAGAELGENFQRSPWTRDDSVSRYPWYQDHVVTGHEPSVIASTLWIGWDAVDQARFELFRQESVGWRAFLVSLTVLPRFASESCIRVAIHVRGGGVLKFTSVGDNDTTVHDVHTYTVAFSSSVLNECRICPYHQSLTRTTGMAQENDPPHMAHSHLISSIASEIHLRRVNAKEVLIRQKRWWIHIPSSRW